MKLRSLLVCMLSREGHHYRREGARLVCTYCGYMMPKPRPRRVPPRQP